MKGNNGKIMNTLKCKEKFFNESGTYIWVYCKGLLVSTNNRKSRPFILKGSRVDKPRHLSDSPAVKYQKPYNK